MVGAQLVGDCSRQPVARVGHSSAHEDDWQGGVWVCPEGQAKEVRYTLRSL